MQDGLDQRRTYGERDDEALRELGALQSTWLDLELRLARLFARIDRKRAHEYAGAASLLELAARRGYDRQRARELMQAGHALDAEPTLESRLRAGRVTFPAVIAIGRLYRDPERLLEPDDRWVHWAQSLRLTDLRRRVTKRIEAVRQGRHVVRPWVTYPSRETRLGFRECQRIASRKAGRPLTRGQTLTVLVEFYRDRNDLLQRPARKRRMPHTSSLLTKRGVAAPVRRAILERSGGLCEFGDCDYPLRDLCHLNPHRHGSAREEDDLVGGCAAHHKQYDLGLLQFAGRDAEGHAVFREAASGILLRPKPPPEKCEVIEKPAWLLKAIGRWRPRPDPDRRRDRDRGRMRWPKPDEVHRARPRQPGRVNGSANSSPQSTWSASRRKG